MKYINVRLHIEQGEKSGWIYHYSVNGKGYSAPIEESVSRETAIFVSLYNLLEEYGNTKLPNGAIRKTKITVYINSDNDIARIKECFEYNRRSFLVDYCRTEYENDNLKLVSVGQISYGT